jgi:hypothetical protein
MSSVSFFRISSMPTLTDLADSHVLQAARTPVDLDDRQANAVAARIELDLRIGAAFTRLQTLQLQTLGEALQNRVISYGRFRPVGFRKISLTISRIVSVSYPGLRGGPLSPRTKL